MKQLSSGLDVGSPHVDPPARRPGGAAAVTAPASRGGGAGRASAPDRLPATGAPRDGSGGARPSDGMSCDSPRHQPAGKQGRPRNRRKGGKGAAQPPRSSSRPRAAAPAAAPAGPYAAAAFFATTVKLLRKQDMPKEELTRVLREVGTAAARIAVGPPAPPPPPADPKEPPPPPPARTSKAARRKERRRRREEAREEETPAASSSGCAATPSSPRSSESDWGIPPDKEGCAALSTARLAEFANRLVRRVMTTGDDDTLSRVRRSGLIHDECVWRSTRDPGGAGAVLQGPVAEFEEIDRRKREHLPPGDAGVAQWLVEYHQCRTPAASPSPAAPDPPIRHRREPLREPAAARG
eukprot:gene3651-20264_t